MILERETNIYNADAIATAFNTRDTRLDVQQGKISAIISETEYQELLDGGKTMYSAMDDIETTVEGTVQSISRINSTIDEQSGSISSMDSRLATYKDTLDEHTSQLSETSTAIGQLNTKYSSITQTTGEIRSSVSSLEETLERDYVTSDKTLSSDVLYYLASDKANGITTSTSGWTTTTQSITATKRYLWVYHKYTYGDRSSSNTTPVIIGVWGNTGNQGEKGDKGDAGTAAQIYYLEVSVDAIVKTQSGSLAPSNVTFVSKTKTGTGTATNYAGRFIIAESTDGTTWTNKYTSSANEASKVYTPSANTVKLLRCTLYLAGGTTTVLDTQTVPIVSDGMNGATAEWYYGTALTHTSGTATLATSQTSGVVVGSMYLNENTSLCYKCTAISGTTATWTYAGDLTTGVLDNLEIGGRNLLFDTNNPDFYTSTTGHAVKYWSNTATVFDDGDAEWVKLTDAPIPQIQYGAKITSTTNVARNHVVSFYSFTNQHIDTQLPDLFIPQDGETYTASCWLKCSVANAIGNISTNSSTGSVPVYKDGTSTFTLGEANVWKRYSKTFTWNGENTTAIIVYFGLARADFQPSLPLTYYVCGFKLEKGEKATDWVDYDFGTEAQGSGRNLIRNTNVIDVSSYATRPNINGYYNDGTHYGEVETVNSATIYAVEHGVGMLAHNASNTVVVPGIRFGTATTGSTITRALGNYGLEAGKTYVWSGEYRIKLYSAIASTNTTTYYLGAYLNYGTSDTTTWTEFQASYIRLILPRYRGQILEGKFQIAFRLPDNCERFYLLLKGNNNTASNYAADDFIELKNMKLEKGILPTAWTPAPEDIDKQVTELNAYIDGEVSTLQSQVDGKIETYYQSTDPSTGWTAAQKTSHTGDIWQNSSTGKSYRWSGTAWQEMTTTPPSAIIDTIDGKAQVFVNQPVPPYQKGDLWFNSATSEILTCMTDRASGSYTASDWVKRNKYTDDTAVENLEIGARNLTRKTPRTRNATAYNFIQIPIVEALEANQEYTFQAWGLVLDSNSTGTDIYWGGGSNLLTAKRMKPDENGYLKVTFTVTQAKVDHADAKNLWLNLYNFVKGHDGQNAIIEKWKLEKGSKGTDWTEAPEDIEEEITALNTYIDGELSTIQSQVDGKIETYYQTTDPSSAWTSTALNTEHTGDIWQNSSTGKSYRWSGTAWQEMTTTPPSAIIDTIDGKATIYSGTTTPSAPQENDLWLKGTNEPIKVYRSGAWVKYDMYTDDTYAQEIEEEAKANLVPNISPFFAYTDYKVNNYWVQFPTNYGFSFEAKEDGWIHVTKPSTTSQVRQDIRMIPTDIVGEGKDYTFLFEFRNNNGSGTGTNPTFYVVQNDNSQFWGGNIKELLEGSGSNSTVSFGATGNIPYGTSDVYTKRFVKTSEATGSAHWTNGSRSSVTALCTLVWLVPANNAVDIECRVSLYDGRYTGVYKPYVATLSESTKSADVEYYKSTSPTALSGGSWSTATPTWTEGSYIWSRIKWTKNDGSTGYGRPSCNTGNTGANGKDAYTVILGNESHTFAGNTTSAIFGTAVCPVIAYKGATKVAATVGTIANLPTGLSTSIVSNGTVNASIAITVNENLTSKQGVIEIPITVDGITFKRSFSYSLALKGDTGVSIVEAVPLYYVKSNTSAPSAPTSAITRQDGGSLVNTWTRGIPNISSSYPYMFTCEQIKYSDNTYSWSTVVKDDALVTLTERVSSAEQKITDDAIINTVRSSFVETKNVNTVNLIEWPYNQGTVTEAGITFTPLEDGSIKINGTATRSVGYYITRRLTTDINDNTPFLVPGTYTLSCVTPSISTAFLNGVFISIEIGNISRTTSNVYHQTVYNEDPEKTKSYTTYKNIPLDQDPYDVYDKLYVFEAFILINANKTYNNVIVKPQFEFGSAKTSWQSPKMSSVKASQFSEVKQTAEEINLQVNELTEHVDDGNYLVSKINLSGTTATIQASKVNLTGYITATNLKTSGQTVINGANITTGTISSANGNTTWNLSTGSFTMKSGSIRLGGTSTYSYLNNSGHIYSYANNQKLDIYEALLQGYYNNTLNGLLDLSAQYSNANDVVLEAKTDNLRLVSKKSIYFATSSGSPMGSQNIALPKTIRSDGTVSEYVLAKVVNGLIYAR